MTATRTTHTKLTFYQAEGGLRGIPRRVGPDTSEGGVLVENLPGAVIVDNTETLRCLGVPGRDREPNPHSPRLNRQAPPESRGLNKRGEPRRPVLETPESGGRVLRASLAVTASGRRRTPSVPRVFGPVAVGRWATRPQLQLPEQSDSSPGTFCRNVNERVLRWGREAKGRGRRQRGLGGGECKRYRSRTLWERQPPPSDAWPGNQGARRSPCHHRSHRAPRGPGLSPHRWDFQTARSLIGLRRKPLQALLGIKLNIWALFPLCLLSFLLFPSAKKLKTKPESQATLTSPWTESQKKRKPKVVLSQCLAELLSGTYLKHRTLLKRPGPDITPGAERRLSAGAPRLT
ncbi:uncharacterized protein LOC116077332 [Mastomys coucha]|uniref:uncharacterized protein LOC116077332 n=1 Tax=Mastomys coucha TaxID=35658 RepID=UPI0012619F7A|nr:uncharacterized protein LOC116077332 [Mastomys coucha]